MHSLGNYNILLWFWKNSDKSLTGCKTLFSLENTTQHSKNWQSDRHPLCFTKRWFLSTNISTSRLLPTYCIYFCLLPIAWQEKHQTTWLWVNLYHILLLDWLNIPKQTLKCQKHEVGLVFILQTLKQGTHSISGRLVRSIHDDILSFISKWFLNNL